MQAGDVLAGWHAHMGDPSPERLHALLADDVVFRSPVVHTPQRGRDITAAYLLAAAEVFADTQFTYVHELVGDRRIVLEFTADLDGILLNGVDLIDLDDDGRIELFTVMVRPLQGVNELHRRMGEMLAAMQAARG